MRFDLTSTVSLEIQAASSKAAASSALEDIEAQVAAAIAAAIRDAGGSVEHAVNIRFAGSHDAAKTALDMFAALRDPGPPNIRDGRAPSTPREEGSVAEIMCGALAEVARRRTYAPGPRPEAHLVAVVRGALDAEADIIGGEPRYRLDGWTRRPGGVDLAFDVSGRRVLVECKVDKPAESLWDALKLADILHDHSLDAAFLLYDATDAIWATHPVAPVFTTTGPRRWPMRALIDRWPKAWGELLYGGRGIRPRNSVAELRSEPVAAVALAHGRTARLLRVTSAPSRERQHFDDDGWPVGYEPPDHLRERSRYPAASGLPLGDSADPCHGYPWYARFSQQRLEQLVPTLHVDSFACLRRRLTAERNCSEALRARVDPLRRQPLDGAGTGE